MKILVIIEKIIKEYFIPVVVLVTESVETVVMGSPHNKRWIKLNSSESSSVAKQKSIITMKYKALTNNWKKYYNL